MLQIICSGTKGFREACNRGSKMSDTADKTEGSSEYYLEQRLIFRICNAKIWQILILKLEIKIKGTDQLCFLPTNQYKIRCICIIVSLLQKVMEDHRHHFAKKWGLISRYRWRAPLCWGNKVKVVWFLWNWKIKYMNWKVLGVIMDEKRGG